MALGEYWYGGSVGDHPAEAVAAWTAAEQRDRQLVQAGALLAGPLGYAAGVLVGDALVIQQRCEEAKRAYESVLNGADRMLAAQAQLSLAKCYKNTEDLDTAVAEYLKMIYLYSEQKDMVEQATLSAADIYEQLGKLTEARNLYQKLVKTASTPELARQAQQRLDQLQ